ncbi:GTPase-associated protein 1-related protein [Streptomyces sp. NBC_01242]|uniref:GTPase-associated protein 1-related protein n=1 Tax=unclassified Streptomyces TaxID=2593676 RepID=UPI0022563F5A|nr:GTPase-associated protein 1-related protein [Streptomyces sp. NBC_01242]MCX4794196.1 GTPase-associated protein 1-related protein [Streptomyces sp. NBC_01242]
MSLAQLHYTSASAGDDRDGGGARFTAVGAGIPTPVLAEAEQLLGYEPPAAAPYHPTVDELRSFPEALSFSALSDGSHLLSRTVALGGPGAGRFHAHAVHLPAGTRLPGDALPVTAWRSPNWASSPPDGVVPGRMTHLPASAAFGPQALNDFAVSRSPWLAAVFADLRRVSEEPSSARVVLVERQSADVARWIALAAAVLPPETAQRLTFTTYTRRPAQSPHQVVGVLPDDAPATAGPDSGLRVHDCTGPRPEGPVADAWAETCARIWRHRSPELFRMAAELPGEPFAAGPLAVTALCTGVELGPDGRAAAAAWAAERPYALDEERTRRLTDALTAPGIDRTINELACVSRLLTALDGRSPAATTASLAALLVTEAVHGGDVALEPPARSSFAGPAGERAAAALVAALGDDLRTELATGAANASASASSDAPGRGVARTVQLLRIARLLDVDCADLIPDVVRRMARSLLDEGAAGCAPVLLDLLDEQFDVRTALLGELDRIAPHDPAGTKRLLAGVALPFTGAQALPHLRMCAAAPDAGAGAGDRVKALHAVLRAGGMSPFTEPLVLRTGVGLVWGEDLLTPGEARLLLGGTTSDAHRTAGTWSALVAAALGARADDEEAPELAHDLLRGFPQEIDARARGALLLLEFARELRSGTAEPGWAARARKLYAGAEPVEPGVRDQAFGALARQLLAPDRPEAELYAFVHSDDADLIAAYGRAARHEAVLARLRAEPAYAADCFTVWTVHPHAGRAWTRTTGSLLEEVLRPAVSALSSAAITAVEEAVERAGSRQRAEAFRAWNRSGGTLGRLGKRLARRVRRP